MKNYKLIFVATLALSASAGFTASQLVEGGFTASQLVEGGPVLENPYTKILRDIKSNKRKFDQTSFGPEKSVVEKHLCNTAMCTAGHLVQMAGKKGFKLKEKLGFAEAAALIHAAAHPDHPCQNFGSIPDRYALVYIEKMADIEATQGAA